MQCACRSRMWWGQEDGDQEKSTKKAKMKYTVTNLFYDTMFDSILRGHKICE